MTDVKRHNMQVDSHGRNSVNVHYDIAAVTIIQIQMIYLSFEIYNTSNYEQVLQNESFICYVVLEQTNYNSL